MATEFICAVGPGQADYTSLSDWESGVQCDLTAATTLVFSHGGITGTVADNASVTGVTSGATATVVHCSATQILLETIADGPFQSGEVVRVSAGNEVTISDAGDSAIAVAECATTGDPLAPFSISGSTTSSTNKIVVRADPNEAGGDGLNGSYRHVGVYPTGASDKIARIESSGTGTAVYNDNVEFRGIAWGFTATGDTQSALVSQKQNAVLIDCLIKGIVASYSYINGVHGTGTGTISNSILHGFNSTDCRALRVGSNGYLFTVYNCTFADNTWDIRVESTDDVIAVNNVLNGSDAFTSGVPHGDTGYNIISESVSAGALGTTYTSGTTTSASAGKLINSGDTFVSDGVKVGCIIKNTTDTTYTYVTAVDSETQLSVNDDIFATSEAYTVYTNLYGTLTFNNAAGDDYHLAAADTLAVDAGIGPSSDADVPTTDIDGDARSGATCDIGADEFVASGTYAENVAVTLSAATASATVLRTYDATAAATTESVTVATTVVIGRDAAAASTLSVTTAAATVLVGRDASGASTLAATAGSATSTFKLNVAAASTVAATTAAATVLVGRSAVAASTLPALSSAAVATKIVIVTSTVDPNGSGDYVSLNAADTDLFGATSVDLVTNTEAVTCTCICTNGNADTTAVTISGYTTSATYNITVVVGVDYRHNCTYPASGNVYRMVVSGDPVLAVQQANVIVDGIAIGHTTTANGQWAIYQWDLDAVVIRNCLIKKVGGTHTAVWGLGAYSMDASVVFRAYNNVVLGYSTTGAGGIIVYDGSTGTAYIDNNTVCDCTVGVSRSSDTLIPTNNTVWNCATPFNGTMSSALTNAYSAGSDPGSGGVDLSGYAEGDIFVGSGDYHLCTGSPCIGQGTDLSGTFTTDIDGDTRVAWDIGADEFSQSIVGAATMPSSVGAATVLIGRAAAGSSTLAPAIASATATFKLNVEAASTLAAAIASALASVARDAPGAATLAAVIVSATAKIGIPGAATLPTTTATATVLIGRSAVGASTLPMSVVAATSTFKLNTEAASTLASTAATATVLVGRAATAASTVASITAAGTITRTIDVTATATTAAIQASGTCRIGNVGASTLPATTASAQVLVGRAAVGAVETSSLTATAESNLARHVTAAATTATTTATATTTLERDAPGTSTLAATTASATATLARYVSAAATTAPITATGQVDLASTAAGAATTAPVTASATATFTRNVSGAATTASVTASATVDRAFYAAGAATLPAVTASGQVDTGEIWDVRGAATLPAITVTASCGPETTCLASATLESVIAAAEAFSVAYAAVDIVYTVESKI